MVKYKKYVSIVAAISVCVSPLHTVKAYENNEIQGINVINSNIPTGGAVGEGQDSTDYNDEVSDTSNNVADGSSTDIDNMHIGDVYQDSSGSLPAPEEVDTAGIGNGLQHPESIIDYDCTGLDVLPDFSECINLRVVTGVEGITRIPDNAFANCSQLVQYGNKTGVIDLANVTSIGKNAFVKDEESISTASLDIEEVGYAPIIENLDTGRVRLSEGALRGTTIAEGTIIKLKDVEETPSCFRECHFEDGVIIDGTGAVKLSNQAFYESDVKNDMFKNTGGN